MRYLLLVSHGTMAPGVHSVIKMLLGERDDVLSYSMEDGVSADAFVAGLEGVIAPIGPDDSIVLLGDIIGGSPLTNTLNLLTQKGLLAKTTAFGGMSLPMAISRSWLSTMTSMTHPSSLPWLVRQERGRGRSSWRSTTMTRRTCKS